MSQVFIILMRIPIKCITEGVVVCTSDLLSGFIPGLR